jgi:hypothetical protein
MCVCAIFKQITLPRLIDLDQRSENSAKISRDPSQLTLIRHQGSQIKALQALSVVLEFSAK